MKNSQDIESLEVMLVKMIEDRMLSEDDYNLITKYLDKVKNEEFYEIDNIDGNDEIGSLIKSYNLLIKNI